MKKILLIISCLLAGAIGLYAQTTEETVEIDGLFYTLDNTVDPPSARLVKPADGEYTGSVTLPPSVTYEGTTYAINTYSIYGVFDNSEVKEFTVAEGWTNDDNKLVNVSFRYDSALEKVTLKSFFENSAGGQINLGNNNKTVNMFLRKIDENTTQVIFEKFNIYGPDGKPLTPFLAKFSNVLDTRYYPDENGIITLGANWTTPVGGAHCGLTQMSNGDYWILVFYVEYEGAYFHFRIEPSPNQTGQYTEIDGARYMFNFDHLILTAPAEGDAPYSGDISIPATGLYDGVEYPITEIDRLAFANSTISDITVPENIEIIGNQAFKNCENLESADLSDCSRLTEIKSHTFTSDPALTTVLLPENLEAIYYLAEECPLLSDVKIPYNTRLGVVSMNCPALFNASILSNTDTEVKIKVESTILNWAGEVIEFCAKSPKGGIYLLNDDGVVTLPREDFYGTNQWTGQQVFSNTMTFEPLPENDGYTGMIATLRVPEETDGETSINNIVTGVENALPEFYTISGMRLPGAPTVAGFYIRRCGNTVEKIVIR